MIPILNTQEIWQIQTKIDLQENLKKFKEIKRNLQDEIYSIDSSLIIQDLELIRFVYLHLEKIMPQKNITFNETISISNSIQLEISSINFELIEFSKIQAPFHFKAKLLAKSSFKAVNTYLKLIEIIKNAESNTLNKHLFTSQNINELVNEVYKLNTTAHLEIKNITLNRLKTIISFKIEIVKQKVSPTYNNSLSTNTHLDSCPTPKTIDIFTIVCITLVLIAVFSLFPIIICLVTKSQLQPFNYPSTENTPEVSESFLSVQMPTVPTPLPPILKYSHYDVPRTPRRVSFKPQF